MLDIYRFVMLTKPVVGPIVRVVFICLLIFDLRSVSYWSTRSLKQLTFCFILLFIFVVFQIGIYLWPMSKIFVKFCLKRSTLDTLSLNEICHKFVRTPTEYQRNHGSTESTEAQRNRYKATIAYMFLIIATDILFLSANTLSFYTVLEDNCFSIGKQSRSFMGEFTAKTQKYVLVPAIFFLSDFLCAAYDPFATALGKWFCKTKAADKSSTNDPKIHRTSTVKRNINVLFLFRDVLTASVATAAFFASVFAFYLYTEGFCVHEIWSGECPPAKFKIIVTSKFRYTIDSTVVFPDPAIGTRTRHKLVVIQINSVLLPNTSNIDNECERHQGNLVNDSRATFCEYETYDIEAQNLYEAADSQHLSTINGILLRWPCSVTSKFRHLRKGVVCFYRIKIQLNENTEFVFNYDFIYQLPETLSRNPSGPEWHKLAKYSKFSSMFNSDGDESFGVFKKLFAHVDKDIAEIPLSVPAKDLLTHEPHSLHIKCNRSCHCYECVADDYTDVNKYCHIICPDVADSDYRNWGKKSFCRSDNPDNCEREWEPIKLKPSKTGTLGFPDLINYQDPPSVTVHLPNDEVKARFDPKIELPNPGTFIFII